MVWIYFRAVCFIVLIGAIAAGFFTDVGHGSVHEYQSMLEFEVQKVFERNENGFFEIRDSDTLVIRTPHDPLDINGFPVFFHEAAPHEKYFSCKYYTAMNTRKKIEVCETVFNGRCMINLANMRDFHKTILFPDGMRSKNMNLFCGLGYHCCAKGCCKFDTMEWFVLIIKVLFLCSPVPLIGLALRIAFMKQQPPPAKPLASQEERLRRYRADLEELLRKCHEGRR